VGDTIVVAVLLLLLCRVRTKGLFLAANVVGRRDDVVVVLFRVVVVFGVDAKVASVREAEEVTNFCGLLLMQMLLINADLVVNNLLNMSYYDVVVLR